MDWRGLTRADLSAMSRQVNEARGIDMTNVVQFPPKARPKLVVPTPPRVVELWAEKESRLRAFANNPCDHNKRMFDDSQRRYNEECDKAGWPA